MTTIAAKVKRNNHLLIADGAALWLSTALADPSNPTLVSLSSVVMTGCLGICLLADSVWLRLARKKQFGMDKGI